MEVACCSPFRAWTPILHRNHTRVSAYLSMSALLLGSVQGLRVDYDKRRTFTNRATAVDDVNLHFVLCTTKCQTRKNIKKGRNKYSCTLNTASALHHSQMLKFCECVLTSDKLGQNRG